MFYHENLEKFRLEKGLTQQQVVEQLEGHGTKVHVKTYARYEAGKKRPDADFLYLLSLIFEKPITLFFAPVSYQSGTVCSDEHLKEVTTQN